MRNRILLTSLLLLLVYGEIGALEITVDRALDVPPSTYGAYGVEAVAFTQDNRLLVATFGDLDLIVESADGWTSLIPEFQNEDFNQLRRRRREDIQYSRGLVRLTRVSETEYRFFVVASPLPTQQYQVTVLESGVQVEFLSENETKPPLTSRTISSYDLRNGYRVKLIEERTARRVSVPVIVDQNGSVAANLLDGFDDPFFEDSRTISINDARDQLAMVIAYVPGDDEASKAPPGTRVKKLVVFDIQYDDGALSADGEQSSLSGEVIQGNQRMVIDSNEFLRCNLSRRTTDRRQFVSRVVPF